MSKWLTLCNAEKISPGDGRAFDVNGTAIAVFNVNGDYLAIENVCTHDGSPFILEGLDPRDQLDRDQVTCPHHGAVFCLRTGAALTPPAYENTGVFPVQVIDGVIQVKVQTAT